jgi:dynein heavy chain
LQEDRDEIVNVMRGETKSLGLLDSADNCWATFINKVKANLHVAFTTSPVGEAFRVRSQVRVRGWALRPRRVLACAPVGPGPLTVRAPPPLCLLAVPQRFLATINSTVIDWFQPWPEVSLLSVARKFLDDVDLVSEPVRNAVVEFMPFSFAAVNKVCWRGGCLRGSASPWEGG